MESIIVRPTIFVFLLGLCSLPTADEHAKPMTLYSDVQAPYVFVKYGKPTGIITDVVRQMFERAGIDYRIEFLPWRRALFTAQQTENSCVFPLQRSQERETQFQWVSPIHISQTAFYTLAERNIRLRTIEDVEGLTVGSYAGSAAADYLADQGIQTSLTPNDAPNLPMLMARRIDVWAADTEAANYLIKDQNANQKVSQTLVYFTTLRALGCNLSTEDSMIESLNQSLKSMYQDGSIEAIMQSYR